MRFDAFKAEYEHINQLDAKLNKVSQRRYVIDRQKDGYGAFEIYANVNIVPYPEGPMIHLSVYHSRQGQFADLGGLSSIKLGRIVVIRQIIDEWLAGVLDKLPTSMPWEADLWQLSKI